MDIGLKIKIQTETNCFECFHFTVCDRDRTKRCKNYVRIGYQPDCLTNGCLNCFHNIDKRTKCFYCEDFIDKKEIKIWSLING